MVEQTPKDVDLEEGDSQNSTGRLQEIVDVAPVETFSQSSIAVLETARSEASDGVVTTDDLFVALVTCDCAASRLLADLRWEPEALVEQLLFISGRQAGRSSSEYPQNSPRVTRTLENSQIEAGKREAAEVSTLHILAALLRERTGLPSLLLETPGVGLEPVGVALNNALREGMTDPS